MGTLKAFVGGNWVPILGGGGVNEVAVSPDVPTDPNVELWYDTDDPGQSSQGMLGAGLEAVKPGAPLPTGYRFFATDTKRDWLWDGTGWIILNEPVQTYAPTYSNITVGNGAVISTYRRRHGMCWVRFRFTLGSTSAVGTQPGFSVPIAPDSLGLDIDSKPMNLYDSAASRRLGYLLGSGSNVFILYNKVTTATSPVDTTILSATAPFSWKATDFMATSFEYLMASAYT